MPKITSTNTFDLTESSIVVENIWQGSSSRPLIFVDTGVSRAGFGQSAPNMRTSYTPYRGTESVGSETIGQPGFIKLSITGQTLEWEIDSGSGFTSIRTETIPTDELIYFKSARITVEAPVVSAGWHIIGSINMSPSQNTGAFLQFFVP